MFLTSISESLQCLVLDVKYGKGSFQKSVKDAGQLAHLLTATSQGIGIKTTSFITSMDEPLGLTVGNSLEVIEAVECLRGNGPADIIELVSAQGLFTEVSKFWLCKIFRLNVECVKTTEVWKE